MTKWIWIGLPGAISLFVTAWVLSELRPAMRIDSDGYNNVDLGMTEIQVRRALGVPAGDYGPGAGQLMHPLGGSLSSYSLLNDPKSQKWIAGETAIVVQFDESGRACGKMMCPVHRRSWREAFLLYVGLQERDLYAELLLGIP